MKTNKHLALMAGVACILGALLVGGLAVWIGKGPEIAVALRDCRGIEQVLKENRSQNDLAWMRYRTQELNICHGNKETPADAGNSSSATASLASDTKQQPSNEQPPVVQTVFYYANEPLAAPEWQNSFAGNPVARKPELSGKAMEDLTANEATQEFMYRCSGPKADPMLAVATGMALGITPQLNESQQRQAIAGLASDLGTLNKFCDEINTKIQQEFTTSVVTLPAGPWCSTFSYGGDIPLIVVDCGVNRTTPFKALQLTRKSNGEVIDLRLACGFQLYWHGAPAPQVPQAPAPSPGFTRTEEGVPVPPHGGGPGTSTPGTTPPTTPPTTTPPTTTPPTTTPPTTTPPETCPPGQHGTPPLCKDDPSDGPAHNPDFPDQQKPNPLPASPEMAQPTRPASPPATYVPPAPTVVVPPVNQGGPTPNPTPRNTPPPETGAPAPSAPAEGCIAAPGRTCP